MNHSKPFTSRVPDVPHHRVRERRPGQQEEADQRQQPAVVGPGQHVAEDGDEEQRQSRRDQCEQSDQTGHVRNLPLPRGGCDETIGVEEQMDEAALRRIELFSSLSRKQRRLLAMRGDELDVPAGKVLCCKGKTAHEFFVIEEGTARVVLGRPVPRRAGPRRLLRRDGPAGGLRAQRRRDRGDAAQADRPERPGAEGPRARDARRWPAGSARRSSSAGPGFSRCPERRPERHPQQRAAARRVRRPRTSPPCASAAWRTIARPRPEPGSDARAVRAVEAVEHVREVGLLRSRGRGRAR